MLDSGRGRGIQAFRFDEDSGALTPCGLTEGVRNASYLALDPSPAQRQHAVDAPGRMLHERVIVPKLGNQG